MKKTYSALFFVIIVLLITSCTVPNEKASVGAQSEALETSVSEESISDEKATREETIGEETVLVNPNTLSDKRKAEIRERYTNPPRYDYPDYVIEYTPVHTTDHLLSQDALGMTRDELVETLGEPRTYYCLPQMSHVDGYAYRYNTYIATDGGMVTFVTTYAGTGTDADPFRSVITDIWLELDSIARCGETVAEQMELGILPTFLAVELHGTDYLISEGLLTEAEAVFYAEEQAIYLASQAEQESLPDAEIPETAPEAVVQ